jgi:hypothetical protein
MTANGLNTTHDKLPPHWAQRPWYRLIALNQRIAQHPNPELLLRLSLKEAGVHTERPLSIVILNLAHRLMIVLSYPLMYKINIYIYICKICILLPILFRPLSMILTFLIARVSILSILTLIVSRAALISSQLALIVARLLLAISSAAERAKKVLRP